MYVTICQYEYLRNDRNEHRSVHVKYNSNMQHEQKPLFKALKERKCHMYSACTRT